MSSEFLSRDEVDTLLNGVPSEPLPPPGDASRVRPYNLAAQERIVRGRMPALELINERFARLLRVGLFNFMRRSTDVAVGPVRVLKYGEFVRDLTVPTNINMVQMKPLRGTALFIFDPNLVFLVVDSMFGGDGRLHAPREGHEFTPTEHRIIQRMLEVVFEDYEKSWNPVHEVKCEYVRSEMNPRFATIAAPHEVVVATSFKIELGAAGGEFHICIPYQMVEPIRDLIYSGLPGNQRELDKRSLKLLTRHVQLAQVQLVAKLGQMALTLRQVLEMKVGEVIPIDIPDVIEAQVDGVPVMECKYGVFNGQYALKVTKWLSTAWSDSQHGDKDG